MKKSEQAFPEPFVNDPHWAILHTPGMSKRFYAACAAMQGLLASPATDRKEYNAIITVAYIYADELLRQENNETEI